MKVSEGDAFSEKCRTLYRSSFPRNERIGFDAILRLCGKGRAELLALADGCEFVGSTLTILGDCPCLLYFSIRADLRGNGYGSEALALLRERYGRFFLFAEEPSGTDDGLRSRRISFYRRNGLEDIGGYGRLEIPYRVLACGGITMDEVDGACSGNDFIYLVEDSNIDTD